MQNPNHFQLTQLRVNRQGSDRRDKRISPTSTGRNYQFLLLPTHFSRGVRIFSSAEINELIEGRLKKTAPGAHFQVTAAGSDYSVILLAPDLPGLPIGIGALISYFLSAPPLQAAGLSRDPHYTAVSYLHGTC